MDTDILYFTLAVLAAALALNLKLTLAVLQASRSEREVPQSLLPGMPVPAIAGRAFGSGGKATVGGAGQPAVLLLLASGCPKCKSKLPELETLLPRARQAGLAIWLVSQEPRWRLRRFLGSSPLAGHVVRVSARDYKTVNPALYSPAYLFVNHEGVLEAAGFIGDDNWQAMRGQLESGLEQAA